MKTVQLIAIALTTLFAMASCEKPQESGHDKPVPAATVSVVSISLDKSSVELIEGESLDLTATISPSDATDKSVQWQSDRTDVATVDRNGHVNALKAGEAMVSVQTNDGGKTASCRIIVSRKVISVTGVKLDKSSVELIVGETVVLSATVSPDDATDREVKWSTSNASVATVENGLVTALASGTTTISAQAGDKTATCKVTVSMDDDVTGQVEDPVID